MIIVLANKKSQVQRLIVAKTRMIQWTCGHTRMGRISSEVIKNKVKVAPIKDKMRRTRHKWFDQGKRKSVDAPVRRCAMISLWNVEKVEDDQRRS